MAKTVRLGERWRSSRRQRFRFTAGYGFTKKYVRSKNVTVSEALQ